MFDESILKREEVFIFRLRSLYSRYGYAKFKMSKFEEYDLYARNKSYLVSDHVITFTDTNGKLMALKPDVTLSIVRNSAAEICGVEKTYYDEKVYRPSRGTGSFKEITQLGIECMGNTDDYCVGEVLQLAAQSLREISENSVLAISNIDIVSEVIADTGAGEEEKTALLRCISEKNLHELNRICSSGTVSEEAAEKCRALIQIHGAPKQVFEKLEAAGITGPCVRRLRDAVGFLSASVFTQSVQIDFSIINDSNYYNGIVFKGFVSGIPVSVLSGGCYDRLMQKMGKRSGAVGFAVYLDELERMADPAKEYDVDTILLYSPEDHPLAVKAAATEITSQGLSVFVCKEPPENKRYRSIVRVNGNGVIESC